MSITRADEWIDSKIPPLHLAFFAFGGWQLQGGSLLLTFAGLSFFSTAYMAFGYYLNDLSDRAADRAAGKRKLIASLSQGKAVSIAVLLGALSALGCLPWLGRLPVVIAFLLAILGAITYSAGPRFKERGALGAFSSSISQRVLPALVYAAVLSTSPGLVVAYSAWATLVGLRFILIHQIGDHDADVRSGTVTYVTKHGSAGARTLLVRVLYPLEVISAIALIWIVAPDFPLVAVAGGAWLLVELARGLFFGQRPATENQATLGELVLPVSAALSAVASAPSVPSVAIAVVVAVWSWRVLLRTLAQARAPRLSASGNASPTFLDGIDIDGTFDRSTEAWRGHHTALHESFSAGRPTAMPKYALLKVTTRCNSRCAYCGDWQMNQPDPPLEDIVRVIRDLSEAGVRFLNLSGGEPLLRDDLPEVIAAAKSAGMTTILLTNGTLLPLRSGALEAAGLDAIIMSLDTLDEATHRLHRGVPLEPYLRGLDEVVRMRERNPRMFACVTTVLQEDNLDHVPELVRYANERGLGVQFSPHHHMENGNLCPTIDGTHRERLTALIAGLLASEDRESGVNNSDAYLRAIPDFMEHTRLPKSYRCLAGYVALYVDPDLNLKPCWFMPPIGSLRTETVVDLWHSDQAQEARARVRTGRCPSCWMLCTAELSLRFDR